MNLPFHTPTHIHHARHLLHDPEEFSKAISGARLVADFLAPKQLPTKVEQFQTSTWTLDFQESHVKARVHAPLPDGWVSLGIVLSPTHSMWHGSKATQGDLLRNPPGVPIDGCITPGFTCLAVSFHADMWESARQLAGMENAATNQFAIIRLPSGSFHDIEMRLKDLRMELRQTCMAKGTNDDIAIHAADFVIHMAASAWESTAARPLTPDSYRNRIRLARRAEEWIRFHLAEKTQITNLCLQLKVSRRELEYAFKTAFDCGPQEFLNKLRLNAIHRALLRGNPSKCCVTSVALDHGITHLGRFSVRYHALFGEKPSVTLRKRIRVVH